MPVNITKFRRDIFSFAEAAMKGHVVEFVHKGVTFKVTPERTADKLASVTRLQVINPDYDLESSQTELFEEMQREWEKDWNEL